MQTGFQNSLGCSNKNVKEKGLAFLGAILVLNNVLCTLNLSQLRKKNQSIVLDSRRLIGFV